MMQARISKIINSGIRTFATKLKSQTTDSKRGPPGKRLGAKKIGGHQTFPNEIIMRQRGAKYKPGENVHMGKDHTLHASREGIVKYVRDSWRDKKTYRVHVIEQELPNTKLPNPPSFMYHPELYPELAKNNPQPMHIPIPNFNSKRRVKNPEKLGVRLANEEEKVGNYVLISREDQKKRKSGLLYSIKPHQEIQADIEIDIAKTTESRKLINEDHIKIATDFNVY